MELIFVRHAQAETSGEPDDDPALTSVGRAQAELLAEAARGWKQKPTEILVSPTRRTRETARGLADLLGLAPVVVPWFEEIPRVDSAHRDPVVRGLKSALEARGIELKDGAPDRWQIDNPNRRLVFVGHGGVNAVAVEYLLGMPSVSWVWFRFSFVNAAVSRLRDFSVEGGAVFGMIAHGDVHHLPRHLRTA